MPEQILSARQVGALIDYAVLKPELTLQEITEAATLARRLGAGCLFVRPTDVSIANRALAGSSVKVASVIGFPFGYNCTRAKMAEAEWLLDAGCRELDMVINIGRVKSGDMDFVVEDIAAVVRLAHQQGCPVKVILENCYLTDEEKRLSCRAAEQAGADFVKTSTGMAHGGATLYDIRLMRRSCSPSVGVKASGGIRTLDQLLAALAAGASRVGTSSLEEIMAEARRREQQDGIVLPQDTGR